MLLALGVYSPRPPVETNDTALLRLNRDCNIAHLGGWVRDGIEARESGQRVTVYKNIGYYAFFASPAVHVIDPYGLSDPLLVRLPIDAGTDGVAVDVGAGRIRSAFRR
jgi:hypothetical protein